MKKLKVFGVLSFLIGGLGFLLNGQTINKTDAYFFDSSEFIDTFEGDSIKNEWKKSSNVSLYNQYASLRVVPNTYEWGGHIVLFDKKIDESVTITYDFESFENTSWFAFSYGSPNKSSAFYDAQAAFIFQQNHTLVFDHVDKEILNYTGISYGFSPITATKSERCYVVVDLDRYLIDESVFYKANLGIYNGLHKKVYEQTNISFPNVDGFIGFNSNFSSAEIYSIKIESKTTGDVYLEDFTNSGCSYSSKSSETAKWSTNTFTEEELKIGKKNRLNLVNIEDYATFANPFVMPSNKDIDHLYTLKSKVYFGSQDIGIDTGIEIAKSDIDKKGYFIGIRKNTFGFSLVSYDSDGLNEVIKTTTNELSDMTAELVIDVYRNGKVNVKANDLSLEISLSKVDGYFGVRTRKNTNTSNSKGGMIVSFEYSSSKYRERIDEDMFQDFNGIKTIKDSDGFEYYDFYYNKETWYTGDNVKLSMYRDGLKGNGYVTFSNSGPYSAFGPRTKFAEAIVRFDVEILTTEYTNGAAFGLQFGKQTISTVYENAPGLGIYCRSNGAGVPFDSVLTHPNTTLLPGYNEELFNKDGTHADLFKDGSKFTFLYIIKNNQISMSFKTPEEDDSVLATPKAVVSLDNTDGYISVFGANNASFSMDNFSLINLDFNYDKNSFSSTDVEGKVFQGVTRYNFATSENFDGLSLDHAYLNNGVMKLDENGKVSTKYDISNNILRLTTKKLTDTLSIKRGNITINIVSGSQNKITVNDGVNTNSLLLSNDFNFDGAHFEIINSGSILKVSYASGLEALSKLNYSTSTFEIISDNTYGKLVISSIGGDASLINYSLFNIDSKVTIVTKNFDPLTDEKDPWPIRQTIDESKKLSPLVLSLIIGGGVILLAGAVTATIIVMKRRKNVNEK